MLDTKFKTFFLKKLNYKLIEGEVKQTNMDGKTAVNLSEELPYMINGQVYQIFLPEDAYEEYQQEMNPFKNLSFAEKVTWLEKFNKNS